MKRLFSAILVLLFAFSIAACGENGDSQDTSNSETVQNSNNSAPVAIGDCTVEFLRAERYSPFENGDTLLVYYKFTNNGTLPTSAYKKLYVTAKCGEDRILEMDYQDEHRPEGYNNYATDVAPGGSLEIFYILKLVDGVTEVTIQDIYNTIPETLVVNIDTSTLG